MAEIAPFIGVRYNKEKSADLAPLMAPPYDVITPEIQDELYRRSKHNIVRIDFGRKQEKDDAENNRYTRASAFLKGWLDEGVLVREEKPSIYLYEVEYKTPKGEPKRMSGFICMLRLEEWDKGVVLPHEGTLKGPKEDRLELLKAASASASQIFALYSDPDKAVMQAIRKTTAGAPPVVEVRDDEGATHRLWVVAGPSAIDAARQAMKDKVVFIADGHHRYETALAYRDYRRGQGPWKGDEPFNYVPMFLSNMDEEGLTILPTHRLIKDNGDYNLEVLLDGAARFFDIVKFRFTAKNEREQRAALLEKMEEKGREYHTFGFYFHGEPAYYLLTLRELDPMTEVLRCQGSEVYCNLDVTILHTLVVERVLGINTEDISNAELVQFEKDAGNAVERVAKGEFAMCFLLNPTKVREVKEVALAREIMPQKSTYFYPKLLTGLVLAELS